MGSFTIWHWLIVLIIGGIVYAVYRSARPKPIKNNYSPRGSSSGHSSRIDQTQNSAELYDRVAEELRQNTLRQGLWAKAFAEADGNKEKAQAAYIRYRVAELSNAPLQETTGIQPQVAAVAIWNPNAAANWSLIFTPAFGAYLQMLNWRALGEHEEAASSQNWFYVGLGMLVVYVLMGTFMSDSKAADVAVRGLGFLFLLVWYFSSGRAQGKYVKEKFGAAYAKKPWGRVLLIGLGAIVGYFIAAVVFGHVLGAFA